MTKDKVQTELLLEEMAKDSRKYKRNLQTVNRDTFEYVLLDENRPQIVSSLLKVFQKNNSKHVTQQRSSQFINEQQAAARLALEELS